GLQAGPPAANLDAGYACRGGVSKINPYDAPPDYAGVRKLIAARDASLGASMEMLRAKKNWDPMRLEQFRAGAIRQLKAEPLPAEDVAAEVRCWQTEIDWAKVPTLGGWADAFFNEFNEADLRGLGGAGIPVVQKWK